MDELIRRSDAIKAVKRISENYGGKGKRDYHPHIDFIVDELMYAVPSADRPQEWIPCEEKLPTWEHSYCLITYVTDYSTDILIDCWDDEGKGWCDHQGCGGEVLAWMPLPKPWKGADDETD